MLFQVNYIKPWQRCIVCRATYMSNATLSYIISKIWDNLRGITWNSFPFHLKFCNREFLLFLANCTKSLEWCMISRTNYTCKNTLSYIMMQDDLLRITRTPWPLHLQFWVRAFVLFLDNYAKSWNYV